MVLITPIQPPKAEMTSPPTAMGLLSRYRSNLYHDKVEKVERYQIGGYCPIKLGQVLNEQYEIVAKLGYGGFSTVWLAKDLFTKHDPERTNGWAALKILKSENSGRDNSELALLQRTASEESFVRCLDNFWVQSPNGNHLCLVMEVTGPSLDDTESRWYNEMDLYTLLELSKKCVLALKALHRIGYAHGDVSASNFVIGLDLPRLTRQDIEKFTSRRDNVENGLVWSRDGTPLPAGVPERQYLSLDLDKFVDLSKVKIIDFGEAFTGSKMQVATHSPCRSPELRAQQAATPKSDIWSLGYLLFEIALEFHTPFSTFDIADNQPEYFAKTPDEQYEYLREFLNRHSRLPYREDCLLADLLHKIFVMNPKNRLDTEQILEHEYFEGPLESSESDSGSDYSSGSESPPETGSPNLKGSMSIDDDIPGI